MTTKHKSQKKTWSRDAYGKNEMIQRWRPQYSDTYLNNPHKGTATFQRFDGDALYPTLAWNDSEGPLWFRPPRRGVLRSHLYPPSRVAYCRWLWKVLEPEKGNIRWDVFDGALKAAAERGQTLQIRTQPFIHDTTPEWYWKEGGIPHPAESKAAGYPIPDHNHKAYLRHWGDHIRAIGERYDGHPALESVDVAYGGHCGETGGNCRRKYAERLVDIYMQSFPKTQLVGMLGTLGNAYMAGKRRAVGWRADCYGDLRIDGRGQVPDGLNWNHMFEAYPLEMERDGVMEAWKRAPVTLETCWTVAYWEKQGWDIDWILEQGYKYHATFFMPKSVYIPEAWMDKVMAFNKRLGYRFHVHNMILPLEASPGQRLRFTTTIDNRGIAPLYRRYRFAVRFTQGKTRCVVPFKQDIRKWLPDFTTFTEYIRMPEGLQTGEVTLHCAIIDERDQPVVRFATDAVDKDGWHPMTGMDVV